MLFKPFENDHQSLQIGELIFENQTDKVIVYGDIDITNSAEGLANALRLQEMFTNIASALVARARAGEVPQPSAPASSMATNATNMASAAGATTSAATDNEINTETGNETSTKTASPQGQIPLEPGSVSKQTETSKDIDNPFS